MNGLHRWLLCGGLLLCFVACSDSPEPSADDGFVNNGNNGANNGNNGANNGNNGANNGNNGNNGGNNGEDVGPGPDVSDPGAGPELPEYSGELCPSFVVGRNALQVLDKDRSFLLYLPPNPEGAPLLVLWHWLGGSATEAARAFGAQQLADTRGWIVAVPDSCCSPNTEWGYPPGTVATEQDLTFFDDLMACLDAGYGIDRTRIYTAGFSAGALWSSYLVLERSEYLAAATIFSGGVGLFPYKTPQSRLPVLLVDGGESDVFGGVVNFQTMTEEFAGELAADGHFVVRCQHTAGHTLPQGASRWGFDFLNFHTYETVTSPLQDGLGDRGFPNWCEIVAR